MIVAIALGDSISVSVEAEGPYAPDICADICARACEIFARAIAITQPDPAPPAE